MLNMCKRYQLLAILLTHILRIVSAISIQVPPLFSPSSSSPTSSSSAGAAAASAAASTATSVKPSTLLLPPGFDSQLPPRQPMLYPFVVSAATKSTPPTHKSIGPFITPGWIPISSSQAKEMAVFSSSTTTSSTTTTTTTTTTSTTPKPYSVPVLEDRISKYVLATNENGPVFESIVYGTWKPDPPLQPVQIVNATTSTTTAAKFSSGNSGDDNSHTTISGSIANAAATVGGRVSNKTIHSQHGGFIDNKQQNPIKYENDSHEKSAVMEQKVSNESLDIAEPKPRTPTKIHKKQGRQKIRSNSKASTTASTTTTTAETTSTNQFPIVSTEQSATIPDVVKVNENVPVEVVRQINDSIEIKYNHKQTSRHSIELTAHEHYDEDEDEHLHRQHHHNGDDGDDGNGNDDVDDNDSDDSDDDVEQETKTKSSKASAGLQFQEDEDISVIRMNWPADFMDMPLSSSSTTSTERPSDETDNYGDDDDDDDDHSSSKTTQKSTESDAAELPLALSALNIPQSLWPKLPGNITKLGSPYATENSLEEPAICVPITVREFNMMNSNEVVNIERVFCFPMPSGTNLARETFRASTSTTMRNNIANRGRNTASPVIRASIQNYEEYFESHSTNGTRAHFSAFNSQLYLLCYILVKLFINYD